MEIAELFAEKLKHARHERNLTQAGMAELCELSTRHYNDLELGKVTTRLDTAVRISISIDFSLDSLKKARVV